LDFHANLSAQLVRSEVWKMKDIYSPTLPKESESCNLELFSQKMFSESSVAKQERENLFSNMSEEHWKKWVTQLKSEYSQRVKSACPTKENESSSVAFPTPRSSDSEGGTVKATMSKTGFYRENKKGVKWSVKLKDAVETMHENQTQWKTPTATQVQRTKEGMEKRLKERAKTNRGYNEGCLEEQVVMREAWATPTVMDELPPKDYEASLRHAQGVRKGRTKPSNLREQVNPESVQAYEDAKNWPTPTVAEAGKISCQPNYGQIGLSNHPAIQGTPNRPKGEKDRKKNWSTPRANATDSTRPNRKGGIPLAQQAKESWATPTARDFKDSPNDKTGRDYTLGKQVNGWSPNRPADPTTNSINGKPHESLQKGYLNPNWVEQLMDLPIGWTQCSIEPIDSDSLGMESSQR
jgi:hypothetical protein